MERSCWTLTVLIKVEQLNDNLLKFPQAQGCGAVHCQRHINNEILTVVPDCQLRFANYNMIDGIEIFQSNEPLKVVSLYVDKIYPQHIVNYTFIVENAEGVSETEMQLVQRE